MGRAIPTSLAGVVEHLELEGDLVVTHRSLRAAMKAAGLEDTSDDRVRTVAYQLQRAGWLGTVRSRNAWEFQPGSRGGPLGSGDRFMEFRAYAATHPNWPGTLAMESAAGLNGLAQRFPEREVIALPKGLSEPKPFRGEWRVITSALPTDVSSEIDDLRVWTLEALLVGIGERPTNYRDTAGLAQWLPEAAGRADVAVMSDLLSVLPAAVRQRTAYLFSAVGDHHTRDKILGQSRPTHVAWFGPRNRSGTFDPSTRVHDTVLRPFMSGGIGA
ncbi:type IV toxin-antitoxin system AbiEi family antitoxin [Nocardioides speluncae]|uniref:type IV toxin-antitoxin system AbiEi family antitoxin n=1 Tax=Nocardioides speluncae TaxID=2670337 RepID=UPI000D691629|nr:type IV toxin-antitoxin system AbiEi family antitoxin [Nocardioides speluncae]